VRQLHVQQQRKAGGLKKQQEAAVTMAMQDYLCAADA
jgi:hypothetical protein